MRMWWASTRQLGAAGSFVRNMAHEKHVAYRVHDDGACAMVMRAQGARCMWRRRNVARRVLRVERWGGVDGNKSWVVGGASWWTKLGVAVWS